MKKIPVLIISVLFINFFSSCGEKKAEEKKSISADLQKALDSTQTNFDLLKKDFISWQENFSSSKANWIKSRPLDSIITAIEKYPPDVRDAWKKLYQPVAMRAVEIDEWENALNEEISVMQKTMDEFASWKKQVENGEITEKAAKEKLEEWNFVLMNERASIDAWKQRWNSYLEMDRADIRSFRHLY